MISPNIIQKIPVSSILEHTALAWHRMAALNPFHSGNSWMVPRILSPTPRAGLYICSNITTFMNDADGAPDPSLNLNRPQFGYI